MMYQCILKQTISLKFATLVVKRSNESNVEPDFDRDVILGSITNLTGSINMAVPVTGVNVYDFCRNTSTFKIIITITLNTTYQNVLFFYEAQYNKTAKRLSFTIQDEDFMSAATTDMDTFKVE